MPDRWLFLLGDTAALSAMSGRWVALTGGDQACLVVLSYGGNWRTYAPVYADTWRAHGAAEVSMIAPDDDGTLNVPEVAARIERASGVFIAGGDTQKYHALYGGGALREVLRRHYARGVPFAGCSAGALLAMDTCVISPQDSGEPQPTYLPGLGLLPGVAVGVHFLEWGGPAALEPTLRDLGVREGWGVDGDACACFRNEAYQESFGGQVVRLTREGDSGAFEVRRVHP